jgi:predicted phosphodiesterase
VPQLLAAGDISDCNSDADEATAQILDANPTGVVVTLGDNSPHGTASDFSRCYHPTWGRHKARTRPSPGNHDYDTGGAAGYFDYFGAAAGDPSEGYYSFDVGAWHIVSLNSNCAEIGGCTRASPQGQWLAADLAANPSVCALAYWHRARFSSGDNHGSSTATRDLWAIFHEHGGDVVLVGHDHVYERFARQDADGNATATGVREFVAGTGGVVNYGFDTPEPNSQVRIVSHGVLQLTLTANTFSWKFLPTDTTLTDSGTETCSGAPPPAAGCGLGPELAAILPLLWRLRTRRHDG